jgi:hypothetical protein
VLCNDSGFPDPKMGLGTSELKQGI